MNSSGPEKRYPLLPSSRAQQQRSDQQQQESNSCSSLFNRRQVKQISLNNQKTRLLLLLSLLLQEQSNKYKSAGIALFCAPAFRKTATAEATFITPKNQQQVHHAAAADCQLPAAEHEANINITAERVLDSHICSIFTGTRKSILLPQLEKRSSIPILRQ